MVATESKWEKSLCPPKCDRKDEPHIWATSLPHLLIVSNNKNCLNIEAMVTKDLPRIDTYQPITFILVYIGQKTNQKFIKALDALYT